MEYITRKALLKSAPKILGLLDDEEVELFFRNINTHCAEKSLNEFRFLQDIATMELPIDSAFVFKDTDEGQSYWAEISERFLPEELRTKP